MAITTNAVPHQWAFYIHGSGVSISCSGTWSFSICEVHIALHKLLGVAFMLNKVAFQLSSEVVVALHLETSTAIAYLCYQGGAASLSRLACHILSLADKHGITLYFSINIYPAKGGSWLFLLSLVGSQVAPASLHSWCCISSLGSTGGGCVGALLPCITPWMSPSSGCLGVECFQPPLDISGELCLSISSFSSPGSIHFPVRTCHRSFQTSYYSGTLLNEGSLVSHCCQHVDRYSLSISNHKGPHHWCLSWLGAQESTIAPFNPSAAQRCVVQTRVLFLRLSGRGRVTEASMTEVYQQCLNE